MDGFTDGVRARAKLWGLLPRLVCVLVAGRYAVLGCATASAVSLDQVREVVRTNESLTSLARLDYEVEYGPRPPTPGRNSSSRKPSGQPFTGYRGTWAQDGIRQHHEYDYLRGPDGVPNLRLQVVTGEVAMSGKRPALMEGSIFPIEEYDWQPGPALYSGIRPFESKLLLSGFLELEGTAIEQATERIRDREAYVAVGRPRGTYYKVFVDCERGVLLRLEAYAEDPRVAHSPTCYDILDILETLRLPNGGWLPVRSERTLGADASRKSWYRVDPNSITIDREGIPDSLFTITFPKEARVVNTIIGTVTQGGKTSAWDPRLQAEAEVTIQQGLESLEQTATTASSDVNSPASQASVGSGTNTLDETGPRTTRGPDNVLPTTDSNWRLLVLVAAAAICGCVATLLTWVWWNHHNSAGRR